MTLITASEIAKFAPHGTSIIAEAISAHADDALPKWGITSAPRLWMLMAMLKVESAGFATLFEDMNYSAERLTQVWPSRFPTLAAAQPYAHNPQALANKVYGGRLGNVGPDDGWLCRGTGLPQATGLSNFSRLAKAMNVSVDQCRAMLTAPATMFECGAATFATWGCLPYADKGDVEGCTKVFNGGLNGLADREAAYTLAKSIWPTLRAVVPVEPPPVAHIDNLPKPQPGLVARLWARVTGRPL